MKNELYHHGIDGQRWGVTHGPPYPLSRSEHRAVVKSKNAMEKRNISYRKSRKFAKRMSDEDLNAAIDRLKREETYRQLVSKDKTEKALRREHKRANKEEVKQTKALKKAQDPTKPKNQNDGVLKKSVKEALGGGIKTMGNAGFQALAKTIWPDAKKEDLPQVEYYTDKDGNINIKSLKGSTAVLTPGIVSMMVENQKQMNFKVPNTNSASNSNNASTTASTSNSTGTGYVAPTGQNRKQILSNVWNTAYDETQDSWD